MTDYPFQIALLISKVDCRCSHRRRAETIGQWLAEDDEHERMYQELVRPGFLEEARREHHQFQVGEGYRRLMAGKRKTDRLRIGKRWTAVAAMGALVIGVALAFLLREQSNGTEQDVHLPVAEVIKPGKAGALLTLSDGRQVVLSDSLETQLKEQTARHSCAGETIGLFFRAYRFFFSLQYDYGSAGRGISVNPVRRYPGVAECRNGTEISGGLCR